MYSICIENVYHSSKCIVPHPPIYMLFITHRKYGIVGKFLLTEAVNVNIVRNVFSIQIDWNMKHSHDFSLSEIWNIVMPFLCLKFKLKLKKKKNQELFCKEYLEREKTYLFQLSKTIWLCLFHYWIPSLLV